MSTQTEPAQQPVHLERIGQIAITVHDLARAKSFYQHTLGMTFLFDAGTMSFFQCGTVRLMLGSSEAGEPVSPSGTILYFTVSDLQAVYTSLKDQGVTFLQEPHHVAKMPDHDLWMAFLNDPDGNTLGLMSEVPHASQS